MNIHDVIIVGAGPAGLTAAVYFGRFRRPCLVLEDGHSRARWIPTSHNIPGFAAGIGGSEFLSLLTKQAKQVGAQIRPSRVSALDHRDGIFTLTTDKEVLCSRYVLLATGVRDHIPAIEGAVDAVTRSVLRICPICDAFEAIDKRIAVIGDGALGEREAEFLSNYSSHVTLLHLRSPGPATPETNPSSKFERLTINLGDIKIRDNRVTLSLDRREREFDVVYLALGCSPQHDLARSLGATCDPRGALTVTAHQETSVPGLYAAGDLVRGLNQVVVAGAESAIAATDIHNRLRAHRV